MAKGTKEVTSVGGMVSKLTAAKIACRAGCGTVIGSGKDKALMQKISKKMQVASYFLPQCHNFTAQQRWLSIQNGLQGKLTVSDHFSKRLHQNESLALSQLDTLAVGGSFDAGSVVTLRNSSHQTIAQGLTHFSSQEIATRIHPSNNPQNSNPTQSDEILILAENLVKTSE